MPVGEQKLGVKLGKANSPFGQSFHVRGSANWWGWRSGMPFSSASIGTEVSIRPISSTIKRITFAGLAVPERKFRQRARQRLAEANFHGDLLFHLVSVLRSLTGHHLPIFAAILHHFRVVSRGSFFLRILEQVEELRTLFLARMGRLVAVDLSVVSQEQLPLPSMVQRKIRESSGFSASAASWAKLSPKIPFRLMGFSF